ncbi:putative late blight resistance proteinR1B-13 [Sesamum alatum]|uniref:Late blight resistance proteinR1B-13 n=1 Tax=Sesamum alatum TaxID=300844 RepID=A0AAE1Z2K1_9LAMI|nr:putative late blight resistance proteinR1B-13 [Sesamum alatum]
MAVAAYASLLSLAHVLDQIQHPVHRHRLRLDTEQLRTLQEKVKHLQEFLEDNHSKKKISQEVEDLARQIPVVADEAEDVIDSHVVYVGTSPDRSDHDAAAMLSSFYQDLDKVIQEMDSIIKELMGVVKEEQDNVKEPKPVADSLPTNASSSRVLPSGGEKSNMVGFDDRLVQIIDQLTRDDSDLKILPIVGMGGIGKTTLARNIFDHAYIVDRFDIRIWFTISQEYSVQEILLRLLNEEKKDSSENSLAELGKQLHQKLFRRRYLIVMDDVWSNKAWDDLKQFFPDNGNGSRVVVTTRLSNVAVLVGSHDPYSMDLLDEENCWNLLCEKVFAQGGCPNPELEQIGKDIAKGCKGLPLALVVIGGLLAKSNMTREYWESVAKNINSFANSEDNEHCLKTLSIKSNRIGPKLMLPSEIWMMPQLRHINITWVVLPDLVDAQDTTTILENLQTLSVIQNFRCTKEVVERIPNLKQLKVEYSNDLKEWSYYCLCNLAHLHKLESLNFMARDFFSESITFPTSLKKLTMSNCKIPWKGMTTIGSLPNLEVLKLYRDAFKGQEWNPVEGEFLRLKALFIESCELVHWTAEDTHFPNLEILSLRRMSVLKEIPSSIGDIVTMKSILVRGCCGLVADFSKNEYWRNNEANGNESLQFYGQTLVIEVNMHCDGSERKVKNAVRKLRGVIYVEVNRKQDRLTVTGDVDPIEVVKTVRKKAGAAYIVTLT